MTSEPLRSSSTSEPKALAHSLAIELDKVKTSVDIDAIGEQAIVRALKAVTFCRGLTIPKGYDVAVVPTFREWLREDGSTVYGMTLRVQCMFSPGAIQL